MDAVTLIVIAVGLVVLLGVVFAAFITVTLFEAAWNSQGLLEFGDDEDDLFDEEHHIRPLLGVVHPKEK